MHEPDEELVRAAAAGAPGAFEQLVRQCQVPLRRYLRHLVADDALADDLTQDVLVKIHGQLHTYRFESRFLTWVFRIARNAALDDRRADARRRRREERAAVPAAVTDPTVGGEVALAIASLPVELREPLLLLEICGFTYAEVGSLLHIPEGTAKSRVHRAREGIASWYSLPRASRG